MGNHYRLYYDSPIGIIELSATEKGLCGLYFRDKKSSSENESPILKKAIEQLDGYFNGNRKEFDLPLDIQGTDFQKKVWEQLLLIPFGTKKTYLDIAQNLGDRNSLRAVGNANGKNKTSIIIPCHRVIGTNGELTGFGGGLWRKQWLLDHESKYIQGSLF
jgi:methylated-DNA-[protein]-cysteine S-methyltransferase